LKKKVKTAFRRFIVKENGAVSIYVIIVTLLLFLFNAVLIDFVRIMVAEYQVEQASKSAIRSAFSSFNKNVQNKGLFVINEGAESPEQIFNDVFEKNLTVNEGDYYRFVDTTMESTSFTANENRTFSNTEIVKHQILEDMKYTAPIEFGKVIMDGILPYSCTMQEAEVYIDISKDVNQLVADRDEAMAKAVNHLINAHNKLDSAEGKVNNPSSSTYPNVNNLEDAKTHFPTYIEEMDAAFENDLEDILRDILKSGKDSEKELKEARKDLTDAQTKNKAIQKKIDDTKKEVDEKYENLNSSQCSDSSLSEVENQLEELTEQINEYVLEDSFFVNAISKTDTAKNSVNGGSPGSSATLVPFVDYQIIDFTQLISSDGGFNATINLLKGYFNTALDDTEEARKYVDDNYEETETGETGNNGGLKDAFEALNKIKEVINKGMALNSDFSTYTELQTLVSNYGSSSENSIQDLDMNEPEQAAEDAFDMIGSLFHNLGSLALDIRDQTYINEYILTRFKSDDQLGLMDPGSYPDNFLFINREVEYILYGSHTPGINYGYALLELTATRFAFNFIASFTKEPVKVIPHPLPKFIAATSWAFKRTVEDVSNLTNGKKVPLLDIRGIKPFATDYKFYLRLFLLMHPDSDDNRINRIQAVVDNKAPEDLINAPTYATAKAEASIDLWFIPGIIELLGTSGILEGQVKDGRYYIETEVDYSY
jgi:hypothetical protein